MNAPKPPTYVHVLLVGWFIFCASLCTAAFNPGWKASAIAGLVACGYGTYLMLLNE